VATAELKEQRDARRARGETVEDSDEEIDLEYERRLRRQQSHDNKVAAAAAAAAAAEAAEYAAADAKAKANKKKKGRKLQPEADTKPSKGGSNGRRKSVENVRRKSVENVRRKSSENKPSENVRRKSTEREAGDKGAKSKVRPIDKGAKSKAKPDGAAKPKMTKTTTKREKDVQKSVGGAREAIENARKLEKDKSKAVMAKEAEKLGVGKKKEVKQPTGNAASGAFMAMAGNVKGRSAKKIGI
jgi:hypothetical protein